MARRLTPEEKAQRFAEKQLKIAERAVRREEKQQRNAEKQRLKHERMLQREERLRLKLLEAQQKLILKQQKKLEREERNRQNRERTEAKKRLNTEKKLRESEEKQKRTLELEIKTKIRWRTSLNGTKGVLEYVQRDFQAGILCPYSEARYARQIGEKIQDLPTDYSGLASVNFLKMAGTSPKKVKEFICEEHYNPNQVMGQRIVDMFKDKDEIDDLELYEVMLEGVKVHRVTKYENNALRPFQETKAFVDPDTSYKFAGVELLPWNSGTSYEKVFDIYPHLREDNKY